jgi:Prokaryotic E2 family A/ThiF family/Prokaryotic homologs of the JAB domain
MSNIDLGLLPFPGDTPVSPGELSIPKAKALALALSQIPFVSLKDARQDSTRPDVEVVILDVEVERGQRVRYDIKRHEIIAIEFSRADQVHPEILPLRVDFPHVPHLNLRVTKLPRSLCIDERPYSEVKLRWTPSSFVESIRLWLSHTAEARLHQANQPLEPLLLVGSQHIILPNIFMGAKSGQSDLIFLANVPSKLHTTFYAHELGYVDGAEKPNALVLALQGAPHLHGLVEAVPNSIEALHELLKPIGIDLLTSLRESIKTRVADDTFRETQRTYLLLLVSFPKLRDSGSEIENVERWAFLCGGTVLQVAEAVGVFGGPKGLKGYLLRTDPTQTGASISVSVLKPHFRLSKLTAAQFNGLRVEPRKFLLIGLGALGSQIYLNLVRSGFGAWTLIDNDIVFPHNLARHALVDCLGIPKSSAVADFTRLIIDETSPATGIESDILSYRASDEIEIGRALADAHAILDCSTSLAVARFLAIDLTSAARRCSCFLNPTGSALVLLSESSNRRIRLDDLEMQYYRMILRTPELTKHLEPAKNSIRYSAGCRDVSATIPQDLVALHAAIASRAFRQCIDTQDASIAVWTCDSGSSEVTKHVADVSEPVFQDINGWIVRYDSKLIESMNNLRNSKLPAETGGVLVGSFDTSRKIVYLVDLLPAPPDSIERPTSFIRGFKGLRNALDSVSKVTNSQVEYVGEWHTHPRGSSSGASGDDKHLLETLSRLMAEDGLPEVMVIVGELSVAVYLKDQARL